MPPVGFEPTISSGERPQTYALDRAATGTRIMYSIKLKIIKNCLGRKQALHCPAYYQPPLYLWRFCGPGNPSRRRAVCSDTLSGERNQLQVFLLVSKTTSDSQHSCTLSEPHDMLRIIRSIIRCILGTQRAEPRLSLFLTLRLLMSYIYGAPILDVSRSHTTTQHSR